MKKLIYIILPILALVLAISIVGCGEEEITPTATPSPTVAPKDIVDIAVADDRFETLVAALQAADLVDTLKGAGPFTVFAPTDDAFNKLPAGTLNSLLQDIPALKNVLLYHVVSGKVMAADVVKLTSATTVLGKNVTVKVEQGNVYINDAKVIITDIKASNGVIHVIDTVLIPPA
jgi:transforming growth factor-beta-induced protein